MSTFASRTSQCPNRGLQGQSYVIALRFGRSLHFFIFFIFFACCALYGNLMSWCGADMAFPSCNNHTIWPTLFMHLLCTECTSKPFFFKNRWQEYINRQTLLWRLSPVFLVSTLAVGVAPHQCLFPPSPYQNNYILALLREPFHQFKEGEKRRDIEACLVTFCEWNIGHTFVCSLLMHKVVSSLQINGSKSS